MIRVNIFQQLNIEHLIASILIRANKISIKIRIIIIITIRQTSNKVQVYNNSKSTISQRMLISIKHNEIGAKGINKYRSSTEL